MSNTSKDTKTTQSKPGSMMEQLLASYSNKQLKLNKGDQVTGEVITETEGEFIVDLGTKAEGILSKKDITDKQIEEIAKSQKVQAYVIIPENEFGQAILSLQPLLRGSAKAQEVQKKWRKFYQALDNKNTLKGQVTEVNKGGLLVEVDGNRGFVPTSQVGLAVIGGISKLDELIGKSLDLKVIEIDPNGNRLIFSARQQPSEEDLSKLSKYEAGQKVSGRIAAVVPFGLFIDLDGVEGVVFSQETSWEPVEVLSSQFAVDQQVEAMVTGIDDNLGRVILSLRQLSQDPFEEIAEQFEVDDVIRGTVTAVDQQGVSFSLKDGVEGYMVAEKIEAGTTYEVGKEVSVLVDSIDERRRRINLAPFITSTKGLIYK